MRALEESARPLKARHEDEVPVPFVGPYGPIPGYVAGWCGHRVAESEWRAGFRVCERCPRARLGDGADLYAEGLRPAAPFSREGGVT